MFLSAERDELAHTGHTDLNVLTETQKHSTVPSLGVSVVGFEQKVLGERPSTTGQSLFSRTRIKPSCATVATSVPSSVKTRPIARPLPPPAEGDTWS